MASAIFTSPEATIELTMNVVVDGWNPDDPTYLWEQVSGPDDAVILNADELTTDVEMPAATGVYIFRLTVDDGEVEASKTVLVAVMDEEEQERFFNRRLYVKINGVDYAADPDDQTKFVMHNSLSITEGEEGADTCTFRMWGHKPGLGSTVLVTLMDPSDDSERRLFKGTLLNDARNFPENYEHGIQTVNAVGPHWHLTRRRYSKTWTNTSASTIAEYIIALTPGFTADVESGLEQIEEFVMDKATPAEALDALAEKCGAGWKVDYYDTVFFGYTREIVPPQPLTPDHKSIIDFQVLRDISQVINKIEVGYNYTYPGSWRGRNEYALGTSKDSIDIQAYEDAITIEPTLQVPYLHGDTNIEGRTVSYGGTRTERVDVRTNLAPKVEGTYDPNGQLESGVDEYLPGLRTWQSVESAPAVTYYFTAVTEEGETSWLSSIQFTPQKFTFGTYPQGIPASLRFAPEWARQAQAVDKALKQLEDDEVVESWNPPTYVQPRPVWQNAAKISYPGKLPVHGFTWWRWIVPEEEGEWVTEEFAITSINVYRRASDNTTRFVGTLQSGGELIDTKSDEELLEAELVPTVDTASFERYFLTQITVNLETIPAEKRYFSMQDDDSIAEIAAMTGDDGIIEGTIFLGDVFNRDRADRVARLFLDVHAQMEVTLNYKTRDQATRAGASLNVAMPDHTGVVKITSVTISDFESFEEDGVVGVSPLFTVAAGTSRVSFEDLLARQLDLEGSVSASGIVNVSGGAGTGVSTGGSVGPAGPRGLQGPAGPTGPPGPAGEDGAAGPTGPTGPAGATGPMGPEGPEGPAGASPFAVHEVPTGAVNGVNTLFTTSVEYVPGQLAVYLNGVRQLLGTDYTETSDTTFTFTTAPATGDLILVDLAALGEGAITGPAGPEGPQGEVGPQGPQGEQGEQGEVGPQGPAGAAGAAGAQGPTGPQGPQGNVGPTGATGPAGPEGPEGDVGPQGPAGADGADGVGVPDYASASENDVLTIDGGVPVWAAPTGGSGGGGDTPIVTHTTPGAAEDIDWSAGKKHLITLDANCTLTFSNPTDGESYLLIVRQDATGGRTITWPSSVVWPWATRPDETLNPNRLDLYTFVWLPSLSKYVASYNQNYTVS